MDNVLIVKRRSYTCIVGVGKSLVLAGTGKPQVEFTIIRDSESQDYFFELHEWKEMVEYVNEQVDNREEAA